MVSVVVRLYATLGRYRPDVAPGQPFRVEVEYGATVSGLLACIGIPEQAAHLAFVNGVQRGPDHSLCDGDTVGLVPPIAGG
ncbi:MAG: MoaD/ThiS family protein [Chloroflexi bacterium]|nr:MoaD/ThiS family protein [Chloroflexota bacterium]